MDDAPCLRFLADENFNYDIVRRVRRRDPAVDIIRVRDLGLSGADDETILERAAQDGRVVLTHDVNTMTRYAYDRVREAKPMPGVFEIARDVPLKLAIEDIALLAACSLEGEWEGQVRYLPLR